MKPTDLTAAAPHACGRRRFLEYAALGAGAGVIGSLLRTPTVRAGSQTDILLLSCMDFRLANETEEYMTHQGLRDKYDHVILAGASLGALTDKYPSWGKAFREHVDIAIKLHQIHKLVVIDHRDCGAYKVLLGEDFSKDPARETAIHETKMLELAKSVKKDFPALEVELLLMGLDGKVEAMNGAGHLARVKH